MVADDFLLVPCGVRDCLPWCDWVRFLRPNPHLRIEPILRAIRRRANHRGISRIQQRVPADHSENALLPLNARSFGLGADWRKLQRDAQSAGECRE